MNRRSIATTFLALFVTGGFLLLNISALHAQSRSKSSKTTEQSKDTKSTKSTTKNSKTTPSKKEDPKKNTSSTPGSSSSSVGGLDLKLLGGLAFPVGDITQLVTMGFGLHLDADLRLMKLSSIELRAGASVGFYSFTNDQTITGFGAVTSNVSTIPILVYGMVALPLQMGLTPYIAVGGGGAASASSLTGGISQDASSFDGALIIKLGAKYSLKSMPALSFVLNAQYLHVFEVTAGAFPGVELGVSYQLGK